MLLIEEFKGVPDWAFTIQRRGLEAVVMKVWSSWRPDYDWLESLILKYPTCWIKNEWNEEGGKAGVWIGTTRDGEFTIRCFEWDDMSIDEEVNRFRV